jgi:hypothetical protein
MEDFEREEKQKKRKTIALTALPFSLIFCIWRLQMNPKAAPPPAAPAAVKHVGTTAPSPAVAGLVKRLTVATYTKDPFTPLVSFAEPNAPVKVAVTQPPVKLTEMFRGGLPMPGSMLTPLRPFEAPAVTVPEPHSAAPRVFPTVNPTAPEKPEMPYTLTGVVLGSPNVAILRHSDGSRRVARAGDMLDGTFRLVSIGEDTVTVAGDGQRFELKLGAMPESAGATDNTKKEAVVSAG